MLKVSNSEALIIEDLTRYGRSSIGDIHQRIGKEIHQRTLRYQLTQLVQRGSIKKEGEKRGTKYFIDN